MSKRTYLHWIAGILIGLVLSTQGEAQTWTWLGGTAGNDMTNAANWTPTGTVNLSSTSTELIFGNSGSYSPSPILNVGVYQIGTLTITNTGTNNLFAGNGTGAISFGTINGLNIASAINFNPSAASVTTPTTPIQTTGPIYFTGANVTITGNGTNTTSSSTLELGRASVGNGGGASIISSGGNPITKAGNFELEIGGVATGLGQININGGSVFLDPYASGFQSNVVTSSGTTFGMHPNTNATYTYSGVISGGGGFYMNGNPGSTAVLTGANTYTGSTTVNAGTLSLASVANNTLLSSASVSIGSGATLDIAANQTINNFSTTGAGSFITVQSGKTLTVNPITSGSTQTAYSGTISGTGGLLAINGSGTFLTGGSKVILNGNNTYTGATAVNGGTLELTGTNTSAITVNSGGTLIGDKGSTTSTLTINSGGTIAVATKFNAGATTLNGGATYFWGLTNAGTSATPAVGGTDYGLLAISGALVLGSGSPITLQLGTLSAGGGLGAASNFDTTQSYQWSLTSGASSLSGVSPSTITIDTSRFANTFTGTFSVSTTTSNLFLNYAGGVAIPEPSAFATLAGVLGLAGTMWRRRHTAARGK